MGGGAAACRTGVIPLALALSILGGCAHSTLPECPAPKASDAPRGPYEEYFQGVKARVSRAWDLQATLRTHDPNGKQFGARDRYLILEVTLDETGAISEMTIHRSSGLAFLDEAGMDAFRRSAPFAAPPPGLLGPNGTVLFPFGFYMEASNNPQRCRPRGGSPVTAIEGG